MYVLGVDVGGSKTACFVSDEKGNILAKGFGGPGNHQVCGIDAAKKSMETAVLEGVDGAGLSKKRYYIRFVWHFRGRRSGGFSDS